MVKAIIPVLPSYPFPPSYTHPRDLSCPLAQDQPVTQASVKLVLRLFPVSIFHCFHLLDCQNMLRSHLKHQFFFWIFHYLPPMCKELYLLPSLLISFRFLTYSSLAFTPLLVITAKQFQWSLRWQNELQSFLNSLMLMLLSAPFMKLAVVLTSQIALSAGGGGGGRFLIPVRPLHLSFPWILLTRTFAPHIFSLYEYITFPGSPHPFS